MKKTVSLMLTVLLTVGLAGCQAKDQNKAENTTQPDSFAEDDFGAAIKEKNEFVLTDQNERFAVYLNGATTEVKIADKISKAEWTTNPTGVDDDSVAGDDEKQKIKSQISLTCYDKNESMLIYNNYTDCVSLKQYQIKKSDHGFTIQYVIGKADTVYLLPTVIEKSRLETFMAQLDEFDAEEIQMRYELLSLAEMDEETKKTQLSSYPSLKNYDLYVMSSEFPDYVKEKISKLFAQAGYTEQDLEKDNKDNAVAQQEKPINFSVQLQYTLTDQGVSVEIPKDTIQVSNNSVSLTDIEVLPYFGAADATQNGYLFVPDGSGAIINYNSGKTQYDAYKIKVYGKDYAINRKIKQEQDLSARFPVFGQKVKDNGYLAVIERGDAIATIHASVSGKLSRYNTVSASYEVKSHDKVNISINSETLTNKYQKTLYNDGIKVSYFFLENQKANYSGMAETYRDYLLSQKELIPTAFTKDVSFHVNFIGAVDYDTSVLGIPVTGIKPITTYTDVQDISQQLLDQNISNLKVKYSYWANGGVFSTAYNQVKPIKQLGGTADLKKLFAFSQNTGIQLYPDAELLYVAKDQAFDGYSKNKDTAHFLNDNLAGKPHYNIATNRRMYSDLLISPKAYSKMVNGFLNSYGKFEHKYLSVGSYGEDLSSDFNKKNSYNRQQVLQEMQTQLAVMQKQGYDLVTDAGNQYVLPYVSGINNLPYQSSEHFLLDESVPFVQMVLHGSIPYSSMPMNLSDDFDTAVLKLIETGTEPNFEWCKADNWEFKETYYDFYSLNYKNWFDQAVAAYQKVNDALSSVQNQAMKYHQRIADDLYETTYENGTKIYVNYSDKDFTNGQITVAAKSYQVMKAS